MRKDFVEPPETEDDKYYKFTDGCGNISEPLCDLINNEFGLMRCSAYQVRLGGAKGILMFKRELGAIENSDEKLRLVELRPSQRKFQT